MIGLRILLLLGFDLAPNDVLAYIILLREVEELADFSGTLGTETLRQYGVGEAGKFFVTLLDDDKRKDGDIGPNDAATNGLAAPLALAPLTIAGVAIRKEKTDTVGNEDTLLHGEALLVVAARNTEDIALEFVADSLSRYFL